MLREEIVRVKEEGKQATSHALERQRDALLHAADTDKEAALVALRYVVQRRVVPPYPTLPLSRPAACLPAAGARWRSTYSRYTAHPLLLLATVPFVRV